MGITRMSDLKRSKTGARSIGWRKKRNHAKGRPAAATRIGAQKIHFVRVRGGNYKRRALRLDQGTFAWASENATRKVRIMSVVYHPSDNDLVRTNTLTKGSIVTVETGPFKEWFAKAKGKPLGNEKYEAPKNITDDMRKSWLKHKDDAPVESDLMSEFSSGRLLAVISSRPGQCGRADGYILEGEELKFYQEAIQKKKKSG
uniref:40S ribosomal protein S8 n=1 Tax=Coptotermes formosanus TaxID=36987 RepID=R4V116_COPFO|nr:40S ribosomal protein S8 [Coptotermes formosanus]